MKNYIFIIYFVIIGIIAVIMTVHDKSAAKKNKFRVPEARLMLTGFLGGALPMYITMKIIRHKTKHKKFMIGLPAEIILQIAIIIFLHKIY